MTIHDDIVNIDASIHSEIDAVLAEIKDALTRLKTLTETLAASEAARKAETDRAAPVVTSLEALNIA